MRSYDDPSDLDALFHRLKSGDDSAIPAILGACGPMIRRRIRGRLHRDAQRFMDDDDIFATLARRLVAATRLRAIQALDLPAFLGYMRGLSEHTLREKARQASRISRLEHAIARRVGASGALFGREVSAASIQRAIAALPEAERALAWMRSRGMRHRAIAESLGISEDVSRQRWRSARIRLEAILRDQL